MTLVVDASVAVKWLLPEPLHEQAIELLDRESVFLAPDLIVSEVGNAAWKKVLRGEIDIATAERAASAICSGLPMLLRSEPLSMRALQIALQLRHPVYDCYYLACAERSDAAFVTADKRFYRVVSQSNYAERALFLGGPPGPQPIP